MNIDIAEIPDFFEPIWRNLDNKCKLLVKLCENKTANCETVQRNVDEFWDSEQGGGKCVNFVDLVKSFQTSIYDLLATVGFDTAMNGPLEVCQKLANS